MKLTTRIVETDVLVIGGGAAGCFNAIKLSSKGDLKISLVDKANIKRSGCLAAGVNALNAYISETETPESFVEYVKNDSESIIREDLVLSIAKLLNDVTRDIESYGLPILKDENGDYVLRGKRSIKINGENIKPILANEVYRHKNIDVFNNVTVIDYIENEGQILGAYGIDLKNNEIIVFNSKITVCATGGASGIYRPNNPGKSKHKMWYSPFNTGAGYAMGIRAGAEMTTFEMRFVALRCKDTIAPTGTIAQGVGAKLINKNGDEFLDGYGRETTSKRLYSVLQEKKYGRGPVYMKTEGITIEQENELISAYLNMAPSQVLRWIENKALPSVENIEIEGTEPYIVGGHTGSGYWIDRRRRTTLKGLYAIGDVAGGSPKKYVTGCFAEAQLAAEDIILNIGDYKKNDILNYDFISTIRSMIGLFSNIKEIRTLEEEMQSVMDRYAGGISENYLYSSESLNIAKSRIEVIKDALENLRGENLYEIMLIMEIRDRLIVSKVLIEHLKARKETRWRAYQENTSYPEKNDASFMKYVNSVYRDGVVNIKFRDLVGKGDKYEHKD